MARQRIQVLLDDEQTDAVARLATAQERPVPELVHDLVGLGLERVQGRDLNRRKALEELTALRRSIEARNGIYPGDPIGEARAERDRQVNAALSGAATR